MSLQTPTFIIPNYTLRRAKLFNDREIIPDTIIIHSISNPKSPSPNSLHSCIDILLQYSSSANYMIGRVGEENGKVIELIPPNRRAWHAGKSELFGCVNLNDTSIGIELCGHYAQDDFRHDSAQINALIELILYLFSEFPMLTVQKIKPHQIVSDSAVRKDPTQLLDNKCYHSD